MVDYFQVQLPLDFLLHATAIPEKCTRYNQKFPDWPPGARTANSTVL
jgi:hypothetical protein